MVGHVKAVGLVIHRLVKVNAKLDMLSTTSLDILQFQHINVSRV